MKVDRHEIMNINSVFAAMFTFGIIALSLLFFAGSTGAAPQSLSPWYRFFLTYDPKPTLMKVKVPVLAIIGEKDLQVPPDENLKAIGDALKAGGNKNYTTREMPGQNHLFQTAQTGNPSEYLAIEETISPVTLKVVGDWILQQVKE